VTCGPEFPDEGKLHRSQDRVRKTIQQTGVSHERANLALSVPLARKILLDSKSPTSQIFIFGDRQRISWRQFTDEKEEASPQAESKDEHSPVASWSDKQREQAAKIPLIFVDCGHSPKPDAGLSDLRLDTVAPLASIPIHGSVMVKNLGDLPQERRLEVLIDGQRHYVSPAISLEPLEKTRHDFTIVFEHGGLHRGQVRLVGGDGSAYNDRCFFSMEVEQGVPVAVIKSREHEIAYLDDAYYLEKALSLALGGGRPIRPTVLTAETLQTEPLSPYAVVFCVNLRAPEIETAQRLSEYVAAGGHLIWTAGDQVEPNAYHALEEKIEGELFPGILLEKRIAQNEAGQDSWKIGAIDADYPPFANLISPPSLYRSVLVYEYLAIDPEGLPPLMTLDDGSPLLVHKHSGKGSVAFLGTTVQVDWTNLPVRNLFLPMIHQWVFYLSGVHQRQQQTEAGAPLVVGFSERIPDSMEILLPSGATLRRPVEVSTDSGEARFTFDETHQPGIYLLRPQGLSRSRQRAFSVNPVSAEISGENLSIDQIENRFPETPFVYCAGVEQLEVTLSELREGTPLWDLFFLLLLLFLIFECFISNKLTTRREKEQTPDYASLLLRRSSSGRGSG
jgi:hypothetical protein